MSLIRSIGSILIPEKPREERAMKFEAVRLEWSQDCNIIVGQSHFIKTVEDLAEIMAASVPGAKWGLAFNEASGPCLVRTEGNDPALIADAVGCARAAGAGHSFYIVIGARRLPDQRPRPSEGMSRGLSHILRHRQPPRAYRRPLRSGARLFWAPSMAARPWASRATPIRSIASPCFVVSVTSSADDKRRQSPLGIARSVMEELDRNSYDNEVIEGLNLSNGTIPGKEFYRCKIKGCNLTETDLSNCVFEECGFFECNFSNPVIRHLKLINVEFTESKIVGINFYNCDQLLFDCAFINRIYRIVILAT